jgi:WD40 repeat protein
MNKLNLTEFEEYPRTEAENIADEFISQIPGIRLISYESPRDPWTTNRHAKTRLSEEVLEPYSSEAEAWLKSILIEEKVEGVYFLKVQLPGHVWLSNEFWIQVDFSPTYEWVESIWRLSKGELSFVSQDESFTLEIFEDEWRHIAEVRRRRGQADSDVYKLALNELVGIKRLNQNYVLSGDSYGDAQLWNIANSQLVHVYQGLSEYANAEMVKDNLVVSRPFPGDGRLCLWSLETGQMINKTKVYHEVSGIGQFVVVDGQHVVTTFYEQPGGMALWDLASGDIVQWFGSGTSFQSLAQIDAEHIISGSWDGSTQLWNYTTGELVHDFEQQEGPIETIARVDSDHFMSGSADKTLHLIEVSNGKTVRLWMELQHPIHRLTALGDWLFVISEILYPIEYKLDWLHLQSLTRIAHIDIPASDSYVQAIETLTDNVIVVRFSSHVKLVRIVNETGRKHSLELIDDKSPLAEILKM